MKFDDEAKIVTNIRHQHRCNHIQAMPMMGEYEFRRQFLTEKIGQLTEKKGPDREKWD